MNGRVISPQEKAFCEAFARLFREQRAAGVVSPRVGRMAAMIAGYGQKSWCAIRAIEAADVMFNKLIKRAHVVNYLRGLGIERIDGRWTDRQSA